MKYLTLKQLATCTAATFIALAAIPVQGQEVAEPDSTEAYVGDLPAMRDCGCINKTCRYYGHSDLFYNFYTEGCSNLTNAQLYLSPLPVPPNVGRTFITYQPFYPHEYMYPHKNRWHNLYDEGRGLNRTKATYHISPCTTLKNVYWNCLRLPR